MSKKGENIYKRKDGRWEGRFIKLYDDVGKAKYGYVYGKTYAETKKKLLLAQNKVTENEIINAKDILFEDLLLLWLHSTKLNVKASTYARYYHIVEKHISPQLGKYLVSRISTQMMENYTERLLTQGRLDRKGGLSPKTVTDILTIIKSIFEYAQYNGFVTICSFKRINIRKNEKEMRVLSLTEQQLLINVLLNDTDLYKLGVLISLYTGIRIGELCALRWENLSLNTQTLKVRETMQRIQSKDVNQDAKTIIVITEPKSQCSIRDIPIPDFLLEILKNFERSPQTYVLTGKVGKFVEPRTMQNRFHSYIQQSGILDANYHALRHTFATRCVEVGFEIKSLSEILGHSNVNITLNKYVHSSYELKYLNMNKLTLPA